MTQKRISKPKKCTGVDVGVGSVCVWRGRGRGGGLGFPTKALTVQNAGSKGPATISKEAGVGGGGKNPFVGVGRECPLYFTLHPTPKHFYLTETS